MKVLVNLHVLAAAAMVIVSGQEPQTTKEVPAIDDAGPPSFRILRIGDQAFTSPPRVNNRREVVGTSQFQSDSPGSPEAFSWRERSGATDLGTLGSGFSIAAAVNERGDVAGESRTGGRKPAIRAFVWDRSKGKMEDLGTLGGRWSSATAMNDAGRVVGESAGEDGRSRPFLWMRGKGMQDLNPVLGLSADDLTRVHAISNNGRIAGATSAFLGFHAFLWDQEGGLRDLGTLGGVSSVAFDVNREGRVVGAANTAAQASHAFLWDADGGMRDLGTLGGAESRAFAMNDRGQVVGTSESSSGRPLAFLWQDDVMLDLNSLLPADSGWVLNEATDINDSGWIVGRGILDGRSEAFLLLPM